MNNHFSTLIMKEGGTAFPTSYTLPNGGEGSFHGMTLRDYFAAQALAGDLSAQNELTGEYTSDITDEFLQKRAKFFYRYADAMIKARGEQS